VNDVKKSGVVTGFAFSGPYVAATSTEGRYGEKEIELERGAHH